MFQRAFKNRYKRSISSFLPHHHDAAVDRDRLAGDEFGTVRCHKSHNWNKVSLHVSHLSTEAKMGHLCVVRCELLGRHHLSHLHVHGGLYAGSDHIDSDIVFHPFKSNSSAPDIDGPFAGPVVCLPGAVNKSGSACEVEDISAFFVNGKSSVPVKLS